MKTKVGEDVLFKNCLAIGCLSVIGCIGAFAQDCSGKSTEVSVLVQKIRTGDPGEILRAAAIGGNAIAPTLRAQAREGRPAGTSEAAAQIALAKLGDEGALQQLARELNQNKRNLEAIKKLGKVANAQAVVVLMEYLVNNRFNENRILNYGDSNEDPLYDVVSVLTRVLPSPPVLKPSVAQSDLNLWIEWWKKNKKIPQIKPISPEVSDAYLKCLVREVEWGSRTRFSLSQQRAGRQ